MLTEHTIDDALASEVIGSGNTGPNWTDRRSEGHAPQRDGRHFS